MKTLHLEHKTKGEILKVTTEGLSPRIQIYKNLDSVTTPDKFTHPLPKGYPAPEELMYLLTTPMELNTTDSLYGLVIQATYEALIEWITKNPDADVDFGKITDWEIINE